VSLKQPSVLPFTNLYIARLSLKQIILRTCCGP